MRTERLTLEPDEYGRPAEPGWRRVDWSRHRHDLVIRGRRLHYVDVGSGSDACVLVHGLASCWQWWLENLPHLAARRRTIALDLPGFGHSEMPRRLSAGQVAEAIESLCAELGLGSVALVGHS